MNNSAQEIFASVLELEPEKRIQYLHEACGNDKALRTEVESLLSAHENVGNFMLNPTLECVQPAPTATTLPEQIGAVIDSYKLLECIGEGGFGVVYMAQQSEPIRRRVALKIIKLGMDTKQVVARFEAERQALAMMEHPNIARVIDGGATENGRPYFVMELVRGNPITEYCDSNRLTTKERLKLFQQICLAVQHAHQKGIIHRDIKPSNVLVTISDGKPVVKVIDFGIAKATNSELTEKTLFTEFRQLIGTPQYMSPEQAEQSNLDIDTRSDIYSLGVLLYEMLTGWTPLNPKRLASAAWHELQRIICEEEPSRPSAQVSSSLETMGDAARDRSVNPMELTNVLRGDLDWIVMKSLEKDRSRRYETANEFADDIERYLTYEPVLATPPSKGYLMQKFFRRHRRAVLLSSLLVTSLLIGLVGTATTAMWAVRERADAIEAQELAEQRSTQVLQLAALAGSPLLEKEKADRLSAAWAKNIDKMRQNVEASDTNLVRLECQYATWLTAHVMRYKDRQVIHKTIQRSEDLIPRAKQVLGADDPNLLSLLNATIQLHLSNDAAKSQIVELYDDLIPAFKAVHGVEKARVLLPEYITCLAKSNRPNDARQRIDEYLSEAEGAKLSNQEIIRLNYAVNELAAWGRNHPTSYNKLLAFRDSGRKISSATKTDSELVNDLKQMQGTWTTKSKQRTVNMTIKEEQADVVFLNSQGKIVQRGNARFALKRSGPCKLLTRYQIGQDPSQGDAVIYSISNNTFIHVEGMLTGVQNQSGPQLRIWKRKTE